MKRGVWIVFGVICIALAAAHASWYFQEPFVAYSNSLDLSDGSIDPSNEEFLIERGSIGVVLVHGLGQSPFMMRELAIYLAAQNITVYAVRAAGHGTNLADLEHTAWEDWHDSLDAGIATLAEKTDVIYLLGVSSGASLVLYTAEHHDIDGIIVIAPPMILTSKKPPLAHLLQYFQRYSYQGIDSAYIGHSYENLPVATVVEFLNLIRTTKKDLALITEPILILQSHADTTVNPDSASYVYDSVSSTEKELFWVDVVGHAIIKEYDHESDSAREERARAFATIAGFIRS